MKEVIIVFAFFVWVARHIGVYGVAMYDEFKNALSLNRDYPFFNMPYSSLE
jgi:hypothetical protein